MSILPLDLLVESGVKIGKVGEVGEKSVGDKGECCGRVVGVLMVEWGELGGLNCIAFLLGVSRSCRCCKLVVTAFRVLFRILWLMISRYVHSQVSSCRSEDYFSMWSSKVG